MAEQKKTYKPGDLEEALSRSLAEESPTPCPSPQELARLIEGRMKGRERDRLLAHLARCSRCYEAFTTGSLLSRPDPPAILFRPRLLAAAASLLVGVISVFLFFHLDRRPDVQRVEETPAVRENRTADEKPEGEITPPVPSRERIAAVEDRPPSTPRRAGKKSAPAPPERTRQKGGVGGVAVRDEKGPSDPMDHFTRRFLQLMAGEDRVGEEQVSLRTTVRPQRFSAVPVRSLDLDLKAYQAESGVQNPAADFFRLLDQGWYYQNILYHAPDSPPFWRVSGLKAPEKKNRLQILIDSWKELVPRLQGIPAEIARNTLQNLGRVLEKPE